MCLDCNHQPQHETENEKNVVEHLEKELQDIQGALARCREQQAYLQADFENFRRNVAKERSEWAAVAQQNIISDLLPVMDNFERAIIDLEESQDLDDSLKARMQGIKLIHKELSSCFDRWQVAIIETTGLFDPSQHEAVAKIPPVEGQLSGTIVDVLQKGYRHQGKVIRPARVVVAQ